MQTTSALEGRGRPVPRAQLRQIRRDAKRQAKETALPLVAMSRLTEAQIAESVGVSRSTVTRWKRDAEFMARVQAMVAAYGAKLHAQMLARIQADCNHIHAESAAEGEREKARVKKRWPQ